VGRDCTDEETAVEPKPYTDIEVRIVGPVTKKGRRSYTRNGDVGKSQRSVLVGIADADRRGGFTLSFRVPDLPPGSYYLMGSEPGGPTLIRITKP
jgi:hypothetical protein